MTTAAQYQRDLSGQHVYPGLLLCSSEVDRRPGQFGGHWLRLCSLMESGPVMRSQSRKRGPIHEMSTQRPYTEALLDRVERMREVGLSWDAIGRVVERNPDTLRRAYLSRRS